MAGAMLAATFQIHDRMRAIAVAWMAGPVVSFAITVAFWDRLGLTALAVAMTAQCTMGSSGVANRSLHGTQVFAAACDTRTPGWN
jgi:hypothetical protein